MSLAKRFDRELFKLFYRRTSWLKAAIGKKLPGRPHEFNRKQVYPILDRLGEVAAEILIKRRARREFRQTHDVKRQWQVKRGKGHGVDAKQESFKRWYKKHIGSKNCVYVFWARRRCVYVGRTLHGHGRPAGWFDRVTRLALRQGFPRPSAWQCTYSILPRMTIGLQLGSTRKNAQFVEQPGKSSKN